MRTRQDRRRHLRRSLSADLALLALGLLLVNAQSVSGADPEPSLANVTAYEVAAPTFSDTKTAPDALDATARSGSIGSDGTDRLVVITSSESSVPALSLGEIRKLFLGKTRRLPDGSLVRLASYVYKRDAFNREALGKTTSQVNRIWSGLQFSGRSRPPREFDNAEAVVRFVLSGPNSIGFVPATAVDERVRIVFEVPKG